jgi:L,D-transpeptidase ErfK/SrfK
VPLGPGRVDGTINTYKVKRWDSLPWIAVRFGVHPVHVTKPSADALRDGLKAGETLHVDQRRITPRFGALEGVVLNIPEAQVYLVDGGELVREYPVAVSTSESKMPIGNTRVVSMTKNPTWHVPKSIQDEMAEKGLEVKTEVPPGPENPLGNRWIGWADGTFGFHGTLVPSSIKRYASHGCVRFLRPHIEDLYDRVHVGTPVRVLYQPVLLAVDKKAVWLSVYPDIYKLDYDFKDMVKTLAAEAGVSGRIDWQAVDKVVQVADGIVTDVAVGSQPSPTPKPSVKPTAKPTAKPSPKPSAIAPSPIVPSTSPVPSEAPSAVPSAEVDPNATPSPGM